MTATDFDPDALAALEEERDFLLRSLDDLERERAAGDIDEHDYRTLRDDYTARAAAVLRAIEERRIERGQPGPRRWGRTVIALVVVAGMAIGAGFAVAAGSGARRPGQVMTGGIGGTPDPSADLLLQAAQAVRAGEVLEALMLYDEVLADRPGHPAALTYKGWLLVNVGTDTGQGELTDRGRDLLRRVTRESPDYPDGWFFYGFYLLRVEEDSDAARAAFLSALASDPGEELAAQARRVLEQIDGTTDR